jgi:Protein of unknown function (DUF2971)
LNEHAALDAQQSPIDRSVKKNMPSLEDAKARISSPSLELLDTSAAPDVLFHYTDAHGLLGIFKDKCLWATDYRFLNDVSEYLYGLSVLHDALAPRMDLLSSFLHNEWNNTAQTLSMVPKYVASMCENGDLLSQWRGYARLHDGYSIALAASAIRNKRMWTLVKMTYSRTQQAKVIHEILDAWLSAEKDSAQEARSEINKHGLRTLYSVIMGFKDPSFSGEHEWRLFVESPPDESVRFRAAAGQITPYVEIPLEQGDIRYVIQGPGNFRHANQRAIHDLSHRCGFGHIEIMNSSVPIG